MTNPFDADIIYAYTRAQALADGEQVDVTATAREAGIRLPTFLTRSVFDAFVTVPADVIGQEEAGRLLHILLMLRHAIKHMRANADRIPFSLHVRNDNQFPKPVNLVAVCGPLDMDDAQPAITIMLPDED